jgi:hypothetical protein
LFQGFIDTINVTYYPDGLNLIQITSFDSYKNLVNSRFANWDTTTGFGFATIDEILELVGIQSGLGISPASVELGGKIPSVTQTNVVAGGIINEALAVGLGIILLAAFGIEAYDYDLDLGKLWETGNIQESRVESFKDDQ